jgi:hypothetical protein
MAMWDSWYDVPDGKFFTPDYNKLTYEITKELRYRWWNIRRHQRLLMHEWGGEYRHDPFNE